MQVYYYFFLQWCKPCSLSGEGTLHWNFLRQRTWSTTQLVVRRSHRPGWKSLQTSLNRYLWIKVHIRVLCLSSIVSQVDKCVTNVLQVDLYQLWMFSSGIWKGFCLHLQNSKNVTHDYSCYTVILYVIDCIKLLTPLISLKVAIKDQLEYIHSLKCSCVVWVCVSGYKTSCTPWICHVLLRSMVLPILCGHASDIGLCSLTLSTLWFNQWQLLPFCNDVSISTCKYRTQGVSSVISVQVGSRSGVSTSVTDDPISFFFTFDGVSESLQYYTITLYTL